MLSVEKYLLSAKAISKVIQKKNKRFMSVIFHACFCFVIASTGKEKKYAPFH